MYTSPFLTQHPFTLKASSTINQSILLLLLYTTRNLRTAVLETNNHMLALLYTPPKKKPQHTSSRTVCRRCCIGPFRAFKMKEKVESDIQAVVGVKRLRITQHRTHTSRQSLRVFASESVDWLRSHWQLRKQMTSPSDRESFPYDWPPT